ncbi:uncharacterized protein LOC110685670 [Chenopodium quinoa]|uniref:Uncharacterized protein n=1 Tax=Chenopodium quinoa TaxID=63459 RepID=A0A803L7E3_CHEQI|nr:uncharacterized protein LOC110685670 [Chenopodium quinoa]
MKDRGKRELEPYNNNGDCFDEKFPDFPCKKHPTSSSSSGGICAYCLTDRLVQLVCQQCGEQKITSCSCSDIISTSNSTSSDVGRISFLLENEKKGGPEISGSKPKHEQRSSQNSNVNIDDLAHLKRCSSIALNDSKRSETAGKFWKIKRLFRKKRDKINQIKNKEENYECNGVTRSRSLSSFRGFYDTDEIGGFPVSYSAARASNVSTGNFMLDSAKRSCFSESEARISNFDYCDSSNMVGPNKNSNIFSLKETEFVSSDDPAFIDLKLNDNSSMSSDHSKVPDLVAMRRNGLGLSMKEFGFRGGDVLGHEMFNNGGGSCRISGSVRERELKKCRKNNKVWKWFFRPQNSSAKFDDHDFKS